MSEFCESLTGRRVREATLRAGGWAWGAKLGANPACTTAYYARLQRQRHPSDMHLGRFARTGTNAPECLASREVVVRRGTVR